MGKWVGEGQIDERDMSIEDGLPDYQENHFFGKGQMGTGQHSGSACVFYLHKPCSFNRTPKRYFQLYKL